MARIRTIKPEFWCDEKLSPLSPTDRLVFLGLISMSDDYGRVHDNVKIIDAFVFPNSDDCVRESLANLSRIGRVRRGNSSSGMPVIEIVNWDRHQKVDKPQPKLALPSIAVERIETAENPKENAIRELVANDSRTALELVAPHTTDHRPTTPTTDLGSTIVDHATKVAKPAKAKFVAPSLEEVRAFSVESVITLDVDLFFDHYSAQGWKLSNGRTMVDWQAAARKWARRDASNRSPKTFRQIQEENTRKAAEEFCNG
jgi:hypothetical protein